MKIYTLPLIISLFSLSIFADPPNDNFCLEQIEPSEHIQTADRLTVVRNHKIDNLIIDFYGTPIQSGIEPFTEGCESRDGKILIYDEKTQEVLFHKSSRIKKFKIFSLPSEILEYSQVFSDIANTNLIIKYNYMGNCGGCYDLLFFSNTNKFKYLGRVHYEPDKYTWDEKTMKRMYIEYSPLDVKTNEYIEKKPYQVFDSLIVE